MGNQLQANAEAAAETEHLGEAHQIENQLQVVAEAGAEAEHLGEAHQAAARTAPPKRYWALDEWKGLPAKAKPQVPRKKMSRSRSRAPRPLRLQPPRWWLEYQDHEVSHWHVSRTRKLSSWRDVDLED